MTKQESRHCDGIVKGQYLSVRHFHYNEFQVTECINEETIDYEVIINGKCDFLKSVIFYFKNQSSICIISDTKF